MAENPLRQRGDQPLTQPLGPLLPEPVEGDLRITQHPPLTSQQKRDLKSQTEFTPGTTLAIIPAPDGTRIATLLSRLNTWLNNNGVFLPEQAIAAIAGSSDPWRVLDSQMDRLTGTKIDADEIKETVITLHEEDARAAQASDPSRLTGGAAVGTPEAQSDDAGRYAREFGRLKGSGLSDFQAHSLLAEWGWLNPYIARPNAELEAMTEALAVMRATGEYTGPVKPIDLLTLPTLESALQLLGEDFSGSLTETDFMGVILTETGIGENPLEAIENAERAASGRPVLDRSGLDKDDRRFIGVPEDFRAIAAPRPPSPLRGGRGQAGFDTSDAAAIAAETGLRGGDLVGPGRDQISQLPEYREGDNYNMFNGLGFEQTVLYQTMLVDAGWLSPEDFAVEQGQRNGGDATWTAMERAMVASNRTIATSWIEAAQISAEARQRNEAGADVGTEPIPVWTPSTFLKPDPDFLAQTVKAAFRSRLGREPTAGEVTALMSSLSGEFRGAFDVQEQLDKAQFEQNIAAQEASLGPIDPETGERVQVPLEEGETFRTVEPGISSLTGVDPISSFQEQFEARFAEEMSRGRQRLVQRDARRDIMGSIFAIDSAVGGGR